MRFPAAMLKALEALAAERASDRRFAALDALARNDADEVAAYRLTEKTGDGGTFALGDAIEIIAPHWSSADAAAVRVAMAREAAPEPVSVGHWGMH